MRIGDDRHGELEIGLGEIGGIVQRGEIRHRIIGRIETVGIDMMQIIDGGLGLVARFAVGDPQRRIVAAGIERIDQDAVFLVADDFVELAARHGAQLVGDRRIGRDHCGWRRELRAVPRFRPAAVRAQVLRLRPG